MERAERLRMWKQGEVGIGEQFLNQSIREAKWKDWPNVTWVMRGKSKVAQCSKLQPHFFHILSVLWLQDTTFLAPVSFLVQTPITQQWLSLPPFLLHYSSPFLNGNYDPPDPLAQKTSTGAVHCIQKFMIPSLAWTLPWYDLSYTPPGSISSFYILYVSKLMFPDNACHFFSPLLLLFTQRWMFFIDVLPFKTLHVFFKKHLSISPHIRSYFPHQYLLLKLSNMKKNWKNFIVNLLILYLVSTINTLWYLIYHISTIHSSIIHPASIHQPLLFSMHFKENCRHLHIFP